MTLPDDDDNHDEDDVFRGDVVRFHFSIQSMVGHLNFKISAPMFDFTCNIYDSEWTFSYFKLFPMINIHVL